MAIPTCNRTAHLQAKFVSTLATGRINHSDPDTKWGTPFHVHEAVKRRLQGF